jgi:RimJ/RimL family protein N-acetyltransferase
VYTTPRLAIEPLAAGHADALFAALDHPDVHRFLSIPDVTTTDALRERIARLEASPPPPGELWWNFAVRLRADGAAGAPVIGRLEATTYGAWGEIAYVFGPRWARRGLATEATAWLVGHLAQHGAAELWAAVHPGNTASQQLLGRLGFTAAERPGRPLGSYDPGDAVFVRRG